MIRPAFLKEGDTIALTCPARKVDYAEIEFAINLFQSWGLKIKLGSSIGKAHHQFGGTDEERKQCLQQLLNDKEIKAIIACRGGYGTVRIMDDLNFNIFMEHPKWLIGFSDITCLHTLLNYSIGVESIHAAMPLTFPSNTNDALNSLKDALEGNQLHYTISANKLNKLGSANGTLIGGNLSILYSLLGTKTIVNTHQTILFIEDLDEYLYHIDRMMMALKRAGKLQHLKALIVGGMTEMKDNVISFGKSTEEIILEHVEEYDYPVCFNFPSGHIADNRALILGKQASLTVTSDSVSFYQ